MHICQCRSHRRLLDKEAKEQKNIGHWSPLYFEFDLHRDTEIWAVRNAVKVENLRSWLTIHIESL